MFTPFAFVQTISAGGGNDPDAQAFIDATGISGTNATAINTLVLDLKSYGLWNKLYTFYPFVGGTANTCKYNLVNPADTDAAYRITYRNSGSLTFNSNGVQNVAGTSNTGMITNFNGVSASIGFSWSAGVYGAVVNPGGLDIGVYPGAGSNNQYYLSGNAVSANIFLTDCFSEIDVRIVVSNATGVGFYQSSRTNNSLVKGYKNGVVIGTNTATTSANIVSWPIALGGSHWQSTGVIQDVSKQQFRTVYFSSALTDTECADMYTIVQAYNTTLGRQV
jgi:hypothetical protein